MVSFEADKRKAISHNIDWLFVILFLIFVISVTLIICVLCFDKKIAPVIDNQDIPEVEEMMIEDAEPKAILPERIDYQALVDEWVDSVGGNRSVLIYDLERDEVVGSYNPDESYNTASLYKLFVVYEGYRKIQAEEWSSEDAAGRTGHTIIECLDLAIRESHSECAETLWSMMGRDYLGDVIVNNYGIVNSNVGGLTSNPQDIAKMLQIYYNHSEITDESLLARMKESFLIQPTTIYNWRQGLPSGFSRANVYNKVGWDFNPDGNYWNIYHDAAIVEFPESNRHFIIVIMTNRVPFQRIRDFGSKFEAQFYGE